MNYILRGRVESGKLIGLNKDRYHKALKAFEGKPLELVLRHIRTPRSDQQNKYYWGVVVEILSNELGYSKDDLHYALREKFLNIFAKDTLRIPKSTTDLSTVEFEVYMTDVRRWAVEFLNISIPTPGEAE